MATRSQVPAACDVMIAGGGMIGSALACALDGLGLRVVVVDAGEPGGKPATSAYDERSTALAPASREIFRTLGVWDALAPEATPIRDIHVSQQGHFGVTRLSAAAMGLPALGYVAPNRAIGAALAQRLERCGDVSMMRPARVQGVAYPDDGISVTLQTGRRRQAVQARLLVAADGTLSACRELLGIAVQRRSYGQSAIVANVTPARGHAGRAFERFTRDGPLALLPLGEDRCALVWTVPEADAAHWMQCDQSEFSAALEQRFGLRLGRIARVGDRQAWPLSLIRAQQLTAPHAVVIGNAAHTLHPVAGQGFNLGLRDVAVLAECIAAGGLADAGMLDHYARRRRGDHARLVRFSDGLVKLFGARRAPWPQVRGAGLLGLDLCPQAAHGFARFAMGVGPHMPQLARGLPLVQDGEQH